MVGGVFAVNGIGDHRMPDGGNAFVDEAIIDMLVIDGFRVIGMKGGGGVVAGAGVHIQEVFGHGGIAGVSGVILKSPTMKVG